MDRQGITNIKNTIRMCLTMVFLDSQIRNGCYMLSSCSTPWLRCDDIRLLFSESMVVRDAAQINPLNCCVHERKNMRLKSMFFIGWIKLYTVMFALQISQLDEIRTISNLITKHFGGSPNPSNHYSSKSPQSFRWFTPNFSSLSPCHIIILKKKTPMNM